MDREKPPSTHSSCVEIPGIRRCCAGSIPGEYPQLGEAPCVVASARSKTIEDGPRHLMSQSPKQYEQAGVCFAQAEA